MESALFCACASHPQGFFPTGRRKPSGGLVGKLSNKLSSKNTGFQRFDDGVEMQNGKGGFGSHA